MIATAKRLNFYFPFSFFSYKNTQFLTTKIYKRIMLFDKSEVPYLQLFINNSFIYKPLLYFSFECSREAIV